MEMDFTIQELEEKRQAYADEAAKVSELAASEDRNLTEDEQKIFDTAISECEKLTAQIERLKKLDAIKKNIAPQRVSEQAPPEVAHTVHAEPVVRNLGKLTHYRCKPLKAFKDDETAYSMGRFFLAAMTDHQSSKDWCRQRGIDYRKKQQLAAGENINTAGGVLVPDEMERAIIDLRETYGVFRREAKVVQMGEMVLNVPRRTGGLTVYYPGENPSSAITESDKSWDNVQLVAKKAATLSRMSSEIAEDAIISLADDLAQEIAYAFSNAEDLAGFNGDGTSTYGGIWGITVKINDGNHAASIATAATNNDSFGEFTLADFHEVVGQLPLYARPNAKWYISAPGFANSMERLAYAGGGNTTMHISGGVGLSFLGYPVVLSQVLNTSLVGTPASGSIACLFGDLQKSTLFGNRRGVTVARSEDRYFDTDQIGIRGTQRFDINNHSLGDGSTAGPIIALKTP